MNKKMAVIVSILISIQMLSGCAQTSESPIIRVKEVDAMEHYQEAENLNVSIEKSGAESLELKDGGIKTESAVSRTLLRTRLGAPKHYQNEVSDATGKLKVFTDADVDIPEVEKVPAIYVRRHDSNQEDIDAILSTGVNVQLNTSIGTEELAQINDTFDAVFIAIGAHAEKKLDLEGEESRNVISAVEMLREIGDEKYPDFTGKRVIVVGGGNVAMDCARTAIRSKAKTVSIVYRRRKEDMTALPAEVEGAIAEGIELLTLKAPLRIEADEKGNAKALWVQPQIIGPVRGGRPSPRRADKQQERLECDVVIMAVGQDIVSEPFEKAGIATRRGQLRADASGALNRVGMYAGGDCVSGPATVIKAIAAEKVAAANIDEFLGFQHSISVDVEIPEPLLNDKIPCGRVNLGEKESWARKDNFEGIEYTMSDEEALQEASRCLRCDRHGCGVLRGGRQDKW